MNSGDRAKFGVIVKSHNATMLLWGNGAVEEAIPYENMKA
jgi:hypothetical protein